MIGSGGEYRRSPLLNVDPEQYDLQELGELIEEDLRSLASGDYSPEVASENLEHYSFEDSIQNESPDWWRPKIAAYLEIDDPTLEDWMDEAISRIDQSDLRIESSEFGKDHLIGEEPPVYLKFGDREQKNGIVTIDRPQSENSSVAPEEVYDEVVGEFSGRNPPGNENVYRIEEDGFDVSVEPDLSSAFFRSTVEIGPDEHSSEIWVPAASSDEALLVGTPSQFSPEVDSAVVSVADDSFTGDPLMDGVADSLDYFLPFVGIARNEISPEAINYRNENHLEVEPYRVKFRSDAWNRFKDLDSEYQNRIQDQLDQIALNPEKTPLDVRESGRIDQVGSDEIYMLWDKHDSEELVELKQIMDRGEAFRYDERL